MVVLARMVWQQADGLSWPSVLVAVSLLIGLAIALLALLRRTRQRQTTILKRIAELEALSEAGRAIVEAQLNITALCELIASESAKIIDTTTFQIGLFQGDFYHIIFWQINQERQGEHLFDLREELGLVGWIRNSRQSLLVHDFHREMDSLPARPRYISNTPPRSAIFIPLISGDQTLGIIAAQSSQPNRFGEDDRRRLTILANQAAAAIANGRLFEQEQRRAAHLELVGQIAQQVNAIQDLDELFHQVVLLTKATFGFHPVSILGMDGQSTEAVIQASSLSRIQPGQIRIPAGLGLIGTAIQSRQTIVSNYTLEDTRFVSTIVGGLPEISAQIRAEIVIPLIVDDNLLGMLDVQSETAGVFDIQEQAVLEALAAQVAIAIHKAQQFAIQREQAWVTTAQFQVADAINKSNDLDELLTTITRLTPMLVGVDQCCILLYDNEQQLYRGSGVYGFNSDTLNHFLKLQIGVGDWWPLDAVHVGMERLFTEQLPDWWPAATDTLILYPLVVKGHTIGCMVVNKPIYQALFLHQVGNDSIINRQDELLRNIASQAAQAVASEQSHIAQQEEAWVNTALLQVAEAINNLIELHEILDTIVRFVPMLVGVKSCLILIWDKKLESFSAGPSYGLTEMGRGLLHSFKINRAEFPVLEKIEFDPHSPAGTYYTVQLPAWLQEISNNGTATVLPLYALGSLVGLLVIDNLNSGRPISGRRLNILTGISQQAAIAVLNDQLYRESAERNRLEQELAVARNIQASFIPSGSPNIPGCQVASYWQAARIVSGDFYDFLTLPNEHWGILVADVADKGIPAALFMALSRTVLRTIGMGRVDPGGMLQRANEIIYNDTTSDLFVTVFYGVWEPETEVLTYANGGHNPPLLLRSDGSSKLLGGHGMALGVLDEIEIESHEIRLRPGDVLIFYTDGITETLNEDEDEFGLERLRMVVSEARQKNVQAIKESIMQAITDFAGDTPQFDDITLVVLKRG